MNVLYLTTNACLL